MFGTNVVANLSNIPREIKKKEKKTRMKIENRK